MNTSPVSKSGAVSRCIVIVTVAMLSTLIADDYFKVALPPLLMHSLGIVLVGLVALRAYLDQSSSRVPTPDSITTTIQQTATTSTTPADPKDTPT